MDPKVPSFGYKSLVSLRDDAKQLRLKARAKEASAITRLLQTVSDTLPQRTKLRERLQMIEKELLEEEEISATDDPMEIHILKTSPNMMSFCEGIDTIFTRPMRFKIGDVLTNESTIRFDLDTRHQDAKDIERDCIVLGNSSTVLYGSNLGYDGVVKAIAAEIGECCEERSDQNVITRFARALLNSVNRTTSGGDAYETIERFFKPDHLVFVAPDSNSTIKPLEISCRLGIYENNQSWEWGVVAKTEAKSKYLIYELDDVDRARPVARVEGTCIRRFGLSLPFPAFEDSRLHQDDGRSLEARNFYELRNSGIVEIHSSLL